MGVKYVPGIPDYSALAYLTGGQNPDGGWGFNRGDGSNVYVTAVISAAL